MAKGLALTTPIVSTLISEQTHGEGASIDHPYRGGCHAPARPYAPVSKPGLLDEGRVPRGVQGRAGA